MKIRKDDKVVVIAGRDKGKEGVVPARRLIRKPSTSAFPLSQMCFPDANPSSIDFTE